MLFASAVNKSLLSRYVTLSLLNRRLLNAYRGSSCPSVEELNVRELVTCFIIKVF